MPHFIVICKNCEWKTDYKVEESTPVNLSEVELRKEDYIIPNNYRCGVKIKCQNCGDEIIFL